MLFDERFCRNYGVVDEREQALLSNSKTLVAGLGGIGGICSEVLVRAGVGNIAALDFDKFEISNLNRQINAGKSTIGKPKTSVFEKHAKEINPKIKIMKFEKKLDAKTFAFYANQIGKYNPKIVIDTFDNAHSRVLLFRICKKLNIPYVFASASRTRGMASVFIPPSDLEKIFHLPSRGKPISDVENMLFFYPRCPSIWGPASNLVGMLAANASLNYLLKKIYPRAPKFWVIDAFGKEIIRCEKF